MSWYRWLLCVVLLVSVDSVWISLLLAFAGFVVGLAHSPLAWPSCAGVLIVSVMTMAVLEILPERWRRARHLAPALAILTVWGVVAVAAPHAAVSRAWWPLEFASGALDGQARIAIALSLLGASYCWIHGAARAREPAGAPQIARSFRVTLVAFMLVLGLEAAGNLDLGTRGTLIPFFVLSLLGMAIARAPRHGSNRRAWLAMMLLTVTFVILAGALVTVAAIAIVRGGAAAMASTWSDLASAVTASVGAALRELLGPGSGAGFQMLGQPMQVPESVVLLTLIAAAALFGYLAYRLLNAPPRIVPDVALDLGREVQESIGESETPAVARVLARLLGRHRDDRRPRAIERYLDYEPGVRDVCILYHRLLDLAVRRGVQILPAQTPYERAASLRRELPRAPVDELTERFVQACYGQRPTAPDVVHGLTKQLEAASGDG